MNQTAAELGQHIGVKPACEHLGVPRSSFYRAHQPGRVNRPRRAPARALSPTERATVRQVLNSERFQDQTPRQVYAELLEEQVYLCHWRTMYRILSDHQEIRERRNQLRHPRHPKPRLVATAPNQLWSWDITKLPGPVKWHYFYLYVVLDVFSRFVVGWLLGPHESETLAQTLLRTTYRQQGLSPDQLTLHSDRGGPMRAKTVAQLLLDLQVTRSFSRPHTPTDNPYSEAQFKTMKYQPTYPKHFETEPATRHWCQTFFQWYNFHHHHCRLGLLTPATVHYGQVEPVQAVRQQALAVAYAQHPERFVHGPPTPPQVPAEVWINQPVIELPD